MGDGSREPRPRSEREIGKRVPPQRYAATPAGSTQQAAAVTGEGAFGRSAATAWYKVPAPALRWGPSGPPCAGRAPWATLHTRLRDGLIMWRGALGRRESGVTTASVPTR